LHNHQDDVARHFGSRRVHGGRRQEPGQKTLRKLDGTAPDWSSSKKRRRRRSRGFCFSDPGRRRCSTYMRSPGSPFRPALGMCKYLCAFLPYLPELGMHTISKYMRIDLYTSVHIHDPLRLSTGRVLMPGAMSAACK